MRGGERGGGEGGGERGGGEGGEMGRGKGGGGEGGKWRGGLEMRVKEGGGVHICISIIVILESRKVPWVKCLVISIIIL